MDLKCKINGVEYKDLVQGLNISEEYNETLDSASIIISNVKKMDLRPYDDVYIYEGEFTGYGQGYELPSFFLHFLVDQFTEEMINPSENADEINYKYKIDLFSETKRLETIQLPNFSVTQPHNINMKKTVYDYIVDVIDLYNPLYKVGKDGEWHYEKKYSIDATLFDIFGQVYSPDFSLNNPNLRDVLTQLMLTKDMIPVVKNDVITAMDISKRNGEFNINKKYISSIVGSRSSDNHCDNLKRTYNNALSQDNTCKMVEFLGFRNSDNGMLTLENMRLETRFPIYKVNKVYMCYYKKIKLLDEQGNVKETRTFLCKQDISKLVRLNAERNLLSEDWIEFNKKASENMTIDELSEYKICTAGYDIGSKYITGFGTKYSYIDNAIFKKDRTYIENILNVVDVKTPYGIYNYGYITANSTVKEGYAYNGTSGELRDRVVNIFENNNMALFMKSLFFEVEYNAFYNGTIIHSKDTDRDDIVINDNSSSSLTLLEQDGVFQKEKANRFGNKAIQINATYDDFSQLQPLGSVYNYGGDTDVIIYHREISLNDNLINCVYYGSKDYVLKNYFTSVNARHRPFNLLTYEESVRRSENKKMYVLMSKENYYVETENKIIDIDISFIDKLVSFYKETELGASKGDFRFEEKINYGYYTYGGEYYASDVNAFASGNSLCFNITMYDNLSGGVYLDSEKYEPDMEEVDEDYIRGSIQKWYLTSDKNTGSAERMGFYVGHIDNSDYFFDKQVGALNDDFYKDIIKNRIFALPKLEKDMVNMTNIVGNEYKINKDTKEIIDMTYQVELISDSDDVFISPWALKLSDLLGNYLKFSEDKTANDFQNREGSYRVITATGYNGSGWCLPIMVLQFPLTNFSNIQVGDKLKAEFEFKIDKSSETGVTVDGFQKDIIYYKFKSTEIVELTEDILRLKGKQTVKLDGGFLGTGTTRYPDEVEVLFKKVGRINTTDTPEGYVWFSNCEVNQVDIGVDKLITCNYFGDNYNIKFDDGNKVVPLNEQSEIKNAFSNFNASTEKLFEYGEMFDERNYEYTDEYLSDENEDETIYYKNMFVVVSPYKLKKENVYNELKEIQNHDVRLYRPNEIFYIGDNPNGNGGKCLTINTGFIGYCDLNGKVVPVQSVQLWYKDEYTYKNRTDGLITKGEKGYHFVFGVNTGFVTVVQPKLYINLSLLSKKDRRVFDEGHNLVGYIRNEAKSTELISSQNYDEIE